MKMNLKPSFAWGVLIGGILMIPLVALSFLGQQAARLAFVPFDLFDWMARNLPSALIGAGRATIEEVVAQLQFGNSSDNAKTAENLIGVLIVLVIGAIAGGLFFFIMNRLDANKRSALPGVILGAIVSVPFMLFSLAVNLDSVAEPLPAVIWILALFGLWGWAVGWSYQRLNVPAATTDTAARMQNLDRRTFLVQLGAATATLTVVGAGLGTLLSRRIEEEVASTVALLPDATAEATGEPLPNAGDPVEPAPGTRAEVTPLREHYRIDIVSNPMGITIEPEGYVLPFVSAIAGADSTPIAQLTLDDIRNNFDRIESYLTMSCISNRVGGDLISSLKWTGAGMQDILASMEVPANATHLKIFGGDNFDETVALDLIASDPRIMLAYEWADQPLTNRHGFPLRIHIPDLYGMKQPKWINRIEFIEGDQEGYWVRRGWDKEARVLATSVIDTVATDSAYTDEAGTPMVPIGGIAWAGARGISKVEVRVDDGEWVEAQLRSPISDRTWRLWRYDWAFTEGSHTFEVRCVENGDVPQIDAVAGTQPSGATGLHSVRQTLNGMTALTQVPPPI